MANRKSKKQLAESDPYYLQIAEMHNMADVQKEYRKLAKRVNQRMVTLEKNGLKVPEGEATHFLKAHNRKRFQERMPKFTAELIAKHGSEKKAITVMKNEILIMHRFEQSKLTTITGRKAFRADAHKKFTEKGVNLDERTMDFFLDHLNDIKDKGKFEYRESIELLATLSQAKEMTLQDIKLFIARAVNSRNPEVVKKLYEHQGVISRKDFNEKLREVKRRIKYKSDTY